MRRRSFLATLAAYPVFMRSTGCAPKALPKIASVSVETEFQLATVFTGGIYAYEPEPPPTITVTVSYDDGSAKSYVCHECSYSFEYSKDIAVCECNVVDNDLIVKMAYAIEGDKTPLVMAVYKDIKEIQLGD